MVRMIAVRHDCAGTTQDTWRSYDCPNRGVLEEEGRWWCRRHAPSVVAAKRAAREAVWDEKAAARDATYRRAADLGVRAGCQVEAYTIDMRPTGTVLLSVDDLDRLLKEAGR
jgi:hypothetical protein